MIVSQVRYQVHGDLDEARKHLGEMRRLAKQAGSVRQKQRIPRLALVA
jgi:hypothetical protein